MYYNKDLINAAPATFAEVEELAKDKSMTLLVKQEKIQPF